MSGFKRWNIMVLYYVGNKRGNSFRSVRDNWTASLSWNPWWLCVQKEGKRGVCWALLLGYVWFPLDQRPGGRFVCTGRMSHRREGAGHSGSTTLGYVTENISCKVFLYHNLSTLSPVLVRKELQNPLRTVYGCSLFLVICVSSAMCNCVHMFWLMCHSLLNLAHY